MREAHIRLPPHLDATVERLAAMSHYSKQEVIRQAILTLAVLIENQAPNDLYIASIRKSFGKGG